MYPEAQLAFFFTAERLRTFSLITNDINCFVLVLLAAYFNSGKKLRTFSEFYGCPKVETCQLHLLELPHVPNLLLKENEADQPLMPLRITRSYFPPVLAEVNVDKTRQHFVRYTLLRHAS